MICLHIGSSSTITVTAPDAPFDVTATLQPMNIVAAAADLVWSPVLRKYPTLKIALSEGGVGWLPYFLDKIDLVYRKQAAWTGQDYGDRLPSDVFREQVVTCFLDDRVTPEVAERSGTELMTWECDYPHSDSDWPESPEIALAGMAGLDDATIDQLTHENAMRIFQFDPYAQRPKDRSTVGALRAEADGRRDRHHAPHDAHPRADPRQQRRRPTRSLHPGEVVAVLYLHQIHDLPPGSEATFEEFARDEWLPAVNAHDGAHFAWYGTSTSAAAVRPRGHHDRRVRRHGRVRPVRDDGTRKRDLTDASRSPQQRADPPPTADRLRPVDRSRHDDPRRPPGGRERRVHARFRAARHRPDARLHRHDAASGTWHSRRRNSRVWSSARAGRP